MRTQGRLAPSWCGQSQRREAGGAGCGGSSALATAFGEGTLGSPRILNSNPALGRGGRSGIWGAPMGRVCLAWGRLGEEMCGMWFSLVPPPRPHRNEGRACFDPCLYCNQSSSVIFFKPPPNCSPLCLTLLFLFFKIRIQFQVKVFPGEPTGLWLWSGSPDGRVQPRSCVLCPSLRLLPLHGLCRVGSPSLFRLSPTGHAPPCSTQRAFEYC